MTRAITSQNHHHRIIDMKKKRPATDAQIRLGELLHKLREHKNVSRKELGKMVKVTEQQIAKYEAGAFVPMAMLENLSTSLGEQIPKKLIRRISALRKIELQEEEEIAELIEVYEEALDPDGWD